MELLDDAGTIFGAKMRASDGRERIRGLREQICEPTAQWDLTLMHRIDELDVADLRFPQRFRSSCGRNARESDADT
jgi:hypothetical protein